MNGKLCWVRLKEGGVFWLLCGCGVVLSCSWRFALVDISDRPSLLPAKLCLPCWKGRKALWSRKCEENGWEALFVSVLAGFNICVVFMTVRENWKCMLSAEFGDGVVSDLLCLLSRGGFCTRCNFHTRARSIQSHWKWGASVCLVQWFLCFGEFPWAGGFLSGFLLYFSDW